MALDSGGLGLWGSGALGFWGFEALRFLGSEALGSAALRLWALGSGALRLWGSGVLRFWGSEALDSGLWALVPWVSGALELSGSGAPHQRRRRHYRLRNFRPRSRAKPAIKHWQDFLEFAAGWIKLYTSQPPKLGRIIKQLENFEKCPFFFVMTPACHDTFSLV